MVQGRKWKNRGETHTHAQKEDKKKWRKVCREERKTKYRNSGGPKWG